MLLASQSQSQFPFSPLAASSRAAVPQAAVSAPAVSAVSAVPVQLAPVVHSMTKNISEHRALPPLPPSAAQFAKQTLTTAAAPALVPVTAGVVRIDSTSRGAGTLVEHTLAETATANVSAVGVGSVTMAPLASTDRRMSVVKEEPIDVVPRKVAVPVSVAATTSTTTVNKKRGREEEEEPEVYLKPPAPTPRPGATVAANKTPEDSDDAFFRDTAPPPPLPPQPSTTAATAAATAAASAHKRAKPSAFTTLSAASPSTSPVVSFRNRNTNNAGVAGSDSGSRRNENDDVPEPVAMSLTVPTASKVSTTNARAAATTSSTSSATSNPSRTSATTNNNDNHRNQDEQHEGDWVEALRGADRTLAAHLKQTQIARDKQQQNHESSVGHEEGHDSESDELPRRMPPACVIEKPDLIGAFIGDHSEPRRIMNSSQTSAASATSSATTSNVSTVRNVKVFRKNKVCSVGVRERMSFTHKQLVLPKESERQIQVSVS